MNLNKQTIKQILFIIVCSTLLIFGLVHISAVIAALRHVVDVLSPLLLGLGLAFVLNLLVNPIEKLWLRIFGQAHPLARKLKRAVAILLSVILVCGVVFLLFFIVLPQIARTVTLLVEQLPKAFAWVVDLGKRAAVYFEKYDISLPEIKFDTKSIVDKISDFVSSKGAAFFTQTLSATSSLLSLLFDIFLGVIFSIYILAGKERLGAQLRKTAFALVSEEKATRFFGAVSYIGRTFANYITGQLTEAVILGALCFLGMLILRIPYAAVISVLVGFTALIPMFGAFIGTGIGAFLILGVDPPKALWFILFILVLQQFEGNVIYPRVVGKSVGLPGLWVLLSVTVGGGLFGLLGMLFGVPVGSVLYFAAERFVNERQKGTKEQP